MAAKTNTAKDLKGPEALFKTSAKLEQEGIWLDYGDFRFRVTRAGSTNTRFKKLFEAKMKPHRRSVSNDTLNNDIADRVTREVWSESIVLGWDSKLGMDCIPYKGEALSFSAANCLQLFEDLPDLFIDVREQSMKLGLFLEGDAEGDAGN
jgi:hypothetical protein